MPEVSDAKRKLFHGTDSFVRAGDVLTPFVAPCLSKPLATPYVYATPHRALAMAYVLKRRFGLSIGVHDFLDSPSLVTFIAHGPKKEGETAELYFQNIMAHRGRFVRVCPDRFTPRTPHRAGRPVSAEWLSRDPVPVLAVTELSGFQAVRRGGIQLFTIQRPAETEARMAAILACGPHPEKIGELVAEGFLHWENERPELRPRNPAQRRQRAAHYGIK